MYVRKYYVIHISKYSRINEKVKQETFFSSIIFVIIFITPTNILIRFENLDNVNRKINNDNN